MELNLFSISFFLSFSLSLSVFPAFPTVNYLLLILNLLHFQQYKICYQIYAEKKSFMTSKWHEKLYNWNCTFAVKYDDKVK